MTQLLAILLLAFPVGCSDDGGSSTGTDTGTDTGADQTADAQPDSQPDGGTTNPPAGCWTSDTATNFAVEDLNDDWADCITGCSNDQPNIPLYNFSNFSNPGWRANIDGEDHEYGSQGLSTGPDLDLLGVIIPGRTMVTFYVEPTDGSQINPVITTHDGFFAMTFNADAEPDSPYARTMVAAPYATEIPFYFFIEHFPNYSNFPSTGFDYEGGSHGYVVRYETSAWAPTELGELSATNTTLSGSGQLNCYGDLVYFRFTAAGPEPAVTVTRTGSASDFVILAAATDTTGGQVVWKGRDWDGSDNDGSADGVVTLSATQFDDGGSGEFVFAVSDFSGAAGPGDFTFDVSVTTN